MSVEKQIIYRPAYTDGCNYFSFIVFELGQRFMVIYAISDSHETHQSIVEYAVEEEWVSENITPIGGGVFFASTGEYERASFHYGCVSDFLLDRIQRKVQKTTCRE